MLTDTSTAPRIGTAWCSSSMTWLLAHSAATRSPSSMPARASALTSRAQRSASSAYVSLTSPSTTAVRSAKIAADRSRKADGVRGANVNSAPFGSVGWGTRSP